MPRKRNTRRKGNPTTTAGAPQVCAVAPPKEEEVEGEDYYCQDTCLPWEVWVEVLGFLSCADLARFSRTCRLFHALAELYPCPPIQCAESLLTCLLLGR